jgi:hypothetical protein
MDLECGIVGLHQVGKSPPVRRRDQGNIPRPRSKRPSVAVLHRSKDSLLITIGVHLPGLNEDKTLQECGVLSVGF